MIDQATKTFEDEGYSVEAKEEPGCRLHVKIFVKPPSAQKAYKKAVKKVNKQISIPGFRKGHAPDQTVISRYSATVEQEWKEDLVNDAYRAALNLTEIYPINKKSIQKPNIESCSQEEGAIVSLSYEHYPEVPSVEFDQIAIPLIEKEAVSEEKIVDLIDEVKRSQADFEKIEGRAVQEGDYVDVSIDVIDQDPPQTIVKDRRFEVTDKQLAPWLKKLLTGLSIDESIEGYSEVDEKADEEAKKNFKPSHLRITCHGIYTIILPELNDELAKKVGAESVEDLRTKIHHNLDKEAENVAHQKRIEALEAVLLEKYSFDLPASLLEEERRHQIAERIKQLKNENISDEEIKSREPEIEQSVSSKIDQNFRLYFLNKQIARQGQVALTNQELNEEVATQMRQNPYLLGQQLDKEHTKEIISHIAAKLLERKTKDYALSQVLTH